MLKMVFVPDIRMLQCTISDMMARDIEADCEVRNELNGDRELHEPGQVIRAMCADPYVKPPVMPRTFPKGIWNVWRPRARDDKYRAPYYIPTDAEQVLNIWALDSAGGYDRRTDSTVLDEAYGLHFSTSSTTVGCIKIAKLADLEWLVKTINEEITSGHYVKLMV